MPSLDTKASGFRPRVGGTAPKPADREPCLGFKDFAERFLHKSKAVPVSWNRCFFHVRFNVSRGTGWQATNGRQGMHGPARGFYGPCCNRIAPTYAALSARCPTYP